MTKEEEQKRIKKAQDKAKKIGHCICNLRLTCPCMAYYTTGRCICSEK